MKKPGTVLIALLFLVACSTDATSPQTSSAPAPPAPAAVSPEQARAIAKEAYIYGFPMVDSYRIQYAYFVDQRGPGVQGRLERDPQHRARLHAGRQRDPDAQLRHAVFVARCRPARRAAGADGAADRAEPLLLAAVRRRLHVQLRLCRQPHHRQRRGQLPAGRSRLEGRQARRASTTSSARETELAFVLYRTQLFGPDDIDNVKKIQAGYDVQPLSEFLEAAGAPARAADRLRRRR